MIMKSPLLRTGIVILVLMMFSSVGVSALKPTIKLAERYGKPDLEEVVPRSFDQWEMDPNQPVAVINPIQEENINRIYDQTLSRTYVGSSGYRIMLSVAYGSDQRSGVALSVHYPEVCYPAQGFEVKSNQTGVITTNHITIPVRRLETVQGNRRSEPVTYWILVGSRLTVGGLDRRLIELRYGLNREIPDGLLFRVSSIDSDSNRAFVIQEQFVKELIKRIPENDRIRLVGAATQ